MEIVFVDDSPTTLAILRSLSAKIEGATAQTFANPVQALSHLESHPADLVIADYSMPSMTGIELIKRVRATALHANTPIIMVTSSSEKAVHNRACEVGATAFLSKPVNAQEFKDCIKRHLGATHHTATLPAA